MKYDFDTIIDRKNSGCFKYDAMKMVYGRDDLLALWVADMEFAIAPEILSKIKERIEHPIFGYNYKDDTQYSNFINYVEEHHDWKLDPSWLQMSPGIVPAINFMVKIFTNPGQRILIQQPVYTPFKDAVTANDRTLVDRKSVV